MLAVDCLQSKRWTCLNYKCLISISNNEMCKSSELTESERFQIIGFHNAGFSRNDINKTLDFAKNDNYADNSKLL